MAQFNITITEELLHGLFLSNGRDEAFSKLLEEIFNQVLLAQSSEQLRAEPYERTEERTAYRNGYRNRELTTRVGTLTLRVPRHRNGQFSTELFARYQCSEQALVLAMMEMVINGVSTRKVEIITEELCGKKFSKSTVSALCKKLDPIIEAFRTRPLKCHYPFLGGCGHSYYATNTLRYYQKIHQPVFAWIESSLLLHLLQILLIPDICLVCPFFWRMALLASRIFL
jgi:transposase-like protein